MKKRMHAQLVWKFFNKGYMWTYVYTVYTVYTYTVYTHPVVYTVYNASTKDTCGPTCIQDACV